METRAWRDRRTGKVHIRANGRGMVLDEHIAMELLADLQVIFHEIGLHEPGWEETNGDS